MRRNVGALLKYVLFIVVVVLTYALIFYVFKLYVEGERYTFMTALYWTLVTMSTLGYGDITFHTDVGRLFSVVVLLSGIVLLLIVLPFAFIRFFYAPWLEAQIHARAPRTVPRGTSGHVILCAYDTVAEELIERLQRENVRYFVLEPDVSKAASLQQDGVSVVAGEPDSTATYRNLLADRARLVLANREDTTNTNIVLTVKEIAPETSVFALAGEEEAIDVLSLSGATRVLPVKKWLGEQLASRVNALYARSHIIGKFEDLEIAELPIRNTPFARKTIRETRLREKTGVSIIAVWERGRLFPARPDLRLEDASVPVITGTHEQLEGLDDLLFIYDVNPNPVLVIGGGRVGRAAARALRHEQDTPVHVIERNPSLAERIQSVADEVFVGDAADYDLLVRAGIMETPSVVLTTHDDAMNIYLASYCRRLNPGLRIVCRITHDRNIESIHRAGADFVLSYAKLGATAVLSYLHGTELVVLGEGLDLFTERLPASLAGKSLAESAIGARTGLMVIGIRQNGELITNPPATVRLEKHGSLVMIGDSDQHHEFLEAYGA